MENGAAAMSRRGGGWRRRGRRWCDDSGAAAVEFAIVLAPLLLVVFGIVNFGLAYHQQIQLSGAAREGARTMAVKNDWEAAEKAARDAAPTVKDMTVTRNPSTCAPDISVTVTVNYPFTFQYLFGSQTIDLRGVGVMRCNG
jgi:Flp pilus assembly protein TadG